MKTKGIPVLAAIICIIATMLMVCGPAAAESVADFYKGKTVKILIGFAAGASGDVMARAAAPYLKKQIGADVVVVNKAGGGGIVARNELYTITQPDGMTFMWDPTLAVWPGWLLDQKGVKYDITKFGYLGGIIAPVSTLVVKSDGAYQSIEDLQKATEKSRWAVSGIAQLPCISALVASDVLGINAKVVPGYRNSRACVTAVVQGEADATAANLDSAARYIESGMKIRMLAYIWYERDRVVAPDLPCLSDFTKIPDKAMTLMESLPVNAKIGFTPPNTPMDRVQYLRDSFDAVLADKDFQNEMVRLFDHWGGAVSGKDLQKMADNIAERKSASLGYYKALVKKYID